MIEKILGITAMILVGALIIYGIYLIQNYKYQRKLKRIENSKMPDGSYYFGVNMTEYDKKHEKVNAN